MLRRLSFILSLAAGLFAASAAYADWRATTTGPVNMRTGPGGAYHRILTIPEGSYVTVFDCTDFNWCEVEWRGRSGWVSGRYLIERNRTYRSRPPVYYERRIYEPPIYQPPVYVPPPVIVVPPHGRPPNNPPQPWPWPKGRTPPLPDPMAPPQPDP